ncbi:MULTISPECIES: LLM class flavin-dependent oxidoreductase [Bradyrhizobium]|uniref:LLM class flavin-dependent oxidoreductase n=1 Tax=Bradyrhizobium TaxID=374 RepID=UPI00155EB94C|nr:MULTISPECIES: LLM class flavin-dependent oxidoreductase [Bradyrhizobium]MDD1522913.1 nitrilotriacetate monooxygenase [Bradyrhizobium sp. WBAH30]MDD1546883.1 nitrilotriacetate monooxygenase [Bradyrhizobium sp. WBAH41]MDD1560569.1 nitrilotriacetate monooxygenase [Bradyrhizobium sp. WBAH23]MDD1567975.1 nitrilotriacetate monooxygenase [Bradyrhizobium sp. WBAH33]MDD1593955.1 nitrilotriacetate monooxygenase [Bradyrhizobium sp. WBAH42]
MPDKKLHLAAFVSAGPVSGSHAGWRHPEANGDLLSAAYYQNIGRLLEQGRFDLLFIADILAIPDTLGSSLDSQLRYGALGALRLDPLVVLSIIAGATKHLGLGATISTTYAQPYVLARALATLDHLSGGRAAWNIVTSFQEAEARNFGLTEQLSREGRYERADEFLEVVTKLWDSWEDSALVRDRQTPLFADPARVHRIDHSGKWFNVQGPLNVSRPPQGRPVFIQAGASDRGRDFAARWAEIIFVTPGLIDVAVEFRNDLRARAARFGRDPDTIKVLPGIVPVIGDTEKQAKALHDQLHELSHPVSGLSTLSYHLRVDLSRFPQDQVLPENLDVPGVEGHYREVSELARRSGLSLAELGQRYGAGRTTSGFAGTPGAVADRMQEWFEAGACDGFMLQVPYLPRGLEVLVHSLVPELQRRRLFRTEYDGSTLRDSLGLPRPAG